MKYCFLVLFLSVAFLAAAQDQTPTPPLPPGNPEHKELPEGEFCVTDNPLVPMPDGGHACECHTHRQCTIDQGTGERVVIESATCLQYCFKDHCHCAMHCPDTH